MKVEARSQKEKDTFNFQEVGGKFHAVFGSRWILLCYILLCTLDIMHKAFSVLFLLTRTVAIKRGIIIIIVETTTVIPGKSLICH
jgi:hypothetical protein